MVYEKAKQLAKKINTQKAMKRIEQLLTKQEKETLKKDYFILITLHV